MPKPQSKVPKRTLFAAMSIMFCLCLTPVYAVRYDLQPYTSCTNGVCSTSLDVGTLGLSQNKINTLKAVNITNFLTKSGVINNFAYSWNGNIVTITGRVDSNVYWSFGVGGDTFDPWWNTTAYNITNWTSTTSVPSTTEGNVNYWHGVKFKTLKAGLKLVEVEKMAGDNYTYVGLQNATHFFLVNATYDGNKAQFNYALANNTEYFLINYDSVVNTVKGVKDPGSFAYVSDNLNISSSQYSQTPYSTYTTYTLKVFSIYKIITQTNETINTSIYYTNSLTLNGNATNVTFDNTTALTIYGQTNLTGVNVTLYRNGTLINSSVNNAYYSSLLTADYYNITAFIGNTSTNETLTLWANMTYTPYVAPPTTVNYSYTICSTNSTLLNHDAKFYNGTFNYTDTYTLCLNDCDNITTSCNRPKYEQNLLVYGFISLMGIILVIIYRRVS